MTATNDLEISDWYTINLLFAYDKFFVYYYLCNIKKKALIGIVPENIHLFSI